MDILGVLSFVMSVMNYNENIDQSMLQKTAKTIMQDIHTHLQEQDQKIDEILKLLEEGGMTDGISEQ